MLYRRFKNQIKNMLLLVLTLTIFYFILMLTYMEENTLSKTKTNQKITFEQTIPEITTQPEMFNVRNILTTNTKTKTKTNTIDIDIDIDIDTDSNTDFINNVDNNHRSNNNKNNNQNNKKRKNSNNKVIATVFGGRKDRMFLLNIYVSKLLNLGYIDEYHIWDCARNRNDSFWLRSESMQLINTRYFGFDSPPPPPPPSSPSKATNNHNNQIDHNHSDKKFKILNIPPNDKWLAYYKYYANSTLNKLNDNDIILKIDDDILFIDVWHFPKYIAFIFDNYDKYWLIFPNIINNGVSAFFQAFSADLGMNLDLLHRSDSHINLDDDGDGDCDGREYYDGSYRDLHHNCGTFEYPTQGLEGTLVMNASKALCWHTFAVKEKQLTGLRSPFIFPVNERFSINFFGTKVENFGEMWLYLEETQNEFGDEKTFTTYVHKQKHKTSVWYGNMVVAHASFGGQEKHIISKVVELYYEYYKNNSELLD